ncbi:MAG: hypothetical protein SGI88_00920 [Candidatus Hydrogenedentes bacterium]|nr:hypothetical protein [Candidatus Hydrogenedentota bacterium]
MFFIDNQFYEDAEIRSDVSQFGENCCSFPNSIPQKRGPFFRDEDRPQIAQINADLGKEQPQKNASGASWASKFER